MKAYQAPRGKHYWSGSADHAPLLARMLLDLYSESHHFLMVQVIEYRSTQVLYGPLTLTWQFVRDLCSCVLAFTLDTLDGKGMRQRDFLFNLTILF